MDQISLKTPNPKCRLFLKIYQQRYLAAGVYLSEAPDPPLPPIKHCVNTYPCTYSHREGGGMGVGEPVGRLEGRKFTRGVENTNMTDSISSL
jgi:hypothetical protein